MSGKEEQFEHTFQQVVSASLQTGRASDAARARILEVLAQAEQQTDGLSLDRAEGFEQAFGSAIERSTHWAVADEVAHRVETAVGNEMARDVLSERSVHAVADDSAKSQYLVALKNSVQRCQQSQTAPEGCRQRVLQALENERQSKVVALAPSGGRSQSRWTRALVAVGSVAAGFALLMGTLVGGAEQAMAASVRQDHQRCCSAMRGQKMKRCASLKDSDFGPLPTATVAKDWDLVASKVCHEGGGKPIVHNVYTNGKKKISIHFWPPESKSGKSRTDAPREIADDGFPVLAWDEKGWTITACSDDIDAQTLASVVGCR